MAQDAIGSGRVADHVEPVGEYRTEGDEAASRAPTKQAAAREIRHEQRIAIDLLVFSPLERRVLRSRGLLGRS